MREDSPVFIVGMPRSGTTLMRSILSAHPHIAIAPETHFLNFWVEQYQYLDLRQQEDFEEFWQAFSHSKRFSYLNISAGAVLERIRSKGTSNYRKVFEAILEEYASIVRKERWGEKTPAHYEYLYILLSWFPNARIIWMIRDPRAVCASYLNVPWSTKHIIGPARRWASCMRELERWYNHPQVRIVRYEDLVKKTKHTLNDIFSFLGERPVTNIDNLKRGSDVQVEMSEGWARRHFEAAQGPIHLQSLRKWSKDLSLSQVKLIEYVTYRWMPMGGYSCKCTWNALLMKIYVILSNASLLISLVRDKKIGPLVRHRFLPLKLPTYGSSLKARTTDHNHSDYLKFFIWGYYGANNLGDDAMLQVIVKHLRLHWKRSQIIVTSLDPVTTESSLDIRAPWLLRAGRRFSLSREFEFLQKAREANVILMGGGTFLQDYGHIWMPLFIRLMRVAVLRFFGKKIFIIGGGAAELHSFIGRQAAKWIVRLCHKAVFRDIQSIKLLQKIGVSSKKMVLSADLTFLLNYNASLESFFVAKNHLSKKCRIGVNILSLYGQILKKDNKERRFSEIMANALDQICKNWNCEIHFIPMMGGPLKNDMIIMKQVKEKMNFNVKTQLHKLCDINATLSLISQMDICIGMRLHFLIFCYLENIPVIGLSYNAKVKSFMDSINAGEWCISNIDKITEIDLLHKLESLRKVREVYPEREEQLSHLRQLSCKNFEILLNAIDLRQKKKF